MKRTQRTIPVHAFGNTRIHLALPHIGRLRLGRLKTLCGLQAVTELSPFAMAEPPKSRCATCFGRVDAEGNLKAE